MRTAVARKKFLRVDNVLRLRNKGQSNETYALLNPKQQVGFVLFGQKFHMAKLLIGEKHRFSIRKFTADFHRTTHVGRGNFFHAENNHTVIQKDFVARFQFVANLRVRNTYTAVIPFNIFGGESELVAVV